jgi:hypothetical protein
LLDVLAWFGMVWYAMERELGRGVWIWIGIMIPLDH